MSPPYNRVYLDSNVLLRLQWPRVNQTLSNAMDILHDFGIPAILLDAVQKDLIVLGAELACDSGNRVDRRIEPARTIRLEQWIHELQEEVPLPRQFILPGANSISAALDLSRTIIRRAERRCVALRETGQIDDPEIHAYLNRLGDFLFTLARYAEEKG